MPVEAGAQPALLAEGPSAVASVSRARSFSADQAAAAQVTSAAPVAIAAAASSQAAPSAAPTSPASPAAPSLAASQSAPNAASPAQAGVQRRPSASELLASKPSPVMRQAASTAQPSQPPAAPQRAAAPQPAAPAQAAQPEAAQPAPNTAGFTPALPGQVDPRTVAAAAAGTQPNDKYRLIFLLASEGMDTASIAKHTNLTRGEIEMLLDLRRQGKI